MIQLQKRDYEILKLCYEQRVVTTEHLRDFVLKEVGERVARRRVQRLEESGVIQRKANLQLNQSRLIQLTRQGVQLAQTHAAVSIPQVRKQDLNTVLHDACVTSVRLRLEALWDGDWLSESVLKAEGFRLIPDGLWTFPNQSQVAVEIERSNKGQKRFRELLARWKDSEVSLILYIAVGEVLHRQIKAYLQKEANDLPVGLVQYEALLQEAPQIWTRLGEVDLFNRRSLG